MSVIKFASFKSKLSSNVMPQKYCVNGNKVTEHTYI